MGTARGVVRGVARGMVRGVVLGGGGSIETLALPDAFPVTLQRNSQAYSIAETGQDWLDTYTGSTVYISPSGNDTTGDGTVGNPYKTLNKAHTEGVDLDRVSMAAGIYATPTTTFTKDLALVAPSGGVYIGRFNDLSTAQVDATGTLWNVDDVDVGETFVGFIRTDGVYPGGIRGSAYCGSGGADGDNQYALDYQTDGIMAVFQGGTSSNFSTGTADTLPDLITAGSILAWTDADTQAFSIGDLATVYIGSGITIASFGTNVLDCGTTGTKTLILDGCEVYGGAQSTVKHYAAGGVISFDTRIGGAYEDNLDYSGTSVNIEVNVTSCWPGFNASNNASTCHTDSKVLRVGCTYRGGSRTVHDVQDSRANVFSCSIGDARFNDKTSLLAGFNTIASETVELDYGDITFLDTFSDGGITNTLFDTDSTVVNTELADSWPY